jgi:hypothetical protein
MKIAPSSFLLLCCCLFWFVASFQSSSLCTSAMCLMQLTNAVKSDNAQGSRERILRDEDEGGKAKSQTNNSGDAGGYTVLIIVLVLTSV